MLLDPSYFEHWNLIPNLSEPDPNNRMSEELNLTIKQVEKEVLSYAFGFKMWNHFKQFISTTGGLDNSAPQYYKDVVYGKIYSKTIGGETKDFYWRGILESEPKGSLLADFVYYTIKNNNATQTTEFGEAAMDGKVGVKASITPKVTKAYNSFVKKLNGDFRSFPSGYTMEGRPFWVINGGVDYFGVEGESSNVSLIRFLMDNKENYPLFDSERKRFGRPIKNEFGI